MIHEFNPHHAQTCSYSGASASDGLRDERPDLLPAVIRSRAEAETLIRLDRMVSPADPAWRPRLVAALVDFVVWSERPTGLVREASVRWLAAALAAGGARSAATARLVAREIAAEAHAFENEALAILATLGEGANDNRSPPLRPAIPSAAAPLRAA